MTVRIEGLEKLRAAYKQSPDIVGRAFKKAISKALIQLEGVAKPITPVDSGFLRNSMASSIFPTGIGGQVIDTAPYASFVHEGTSKWPLSSPPKNPNTVRQFFLVAKERTDEDRKSLWEEAVRDIAHELSV